MTTAPTARQLDYMKALQKRAGVSDHDLQTMMGWRVDGPFGSRLDTARITKASVSLAIDYLKAQVGA